MEFYGKNEPVEPATHEVSQSRGDRETEIFNGARAATENERNMTLLQGIKLYPKAVGWSLLISTCIVMEGYDISLVSNFFAFPQFNRKYGVLGDNGKYEVSAPVSHLSPFISSPVFGFLCHAENSMFWS